MDNNILATFEASGQSSHGYAWGKYPVESWQQLREKDNCVLAVSGVGGQSHFAYIWVGNDRIVSRLHRGEGTNVSWLHRQEVTTSILATFTKNG